MTPSRERHNAHGGTRPDDNSRPGVTGRPDPVCHANQASLMPNGDTGQQPTAPVRPQGAVGADRFRDERMPPECPLRGAGTIHRRSVAGSGVHGVEWWPKTVDSWEGETGVDYNPSVGNDDWPL